MWTCRSELAEAVDATHTRGGGGMGWDVNVHVNLQKPLMLRTRGVGGGWGGMLTFMWTAEAVDATHTRAGTMYIYIEYIYIHFLATRTPGRRRERSSKLCETCSCCEETKNQNWSHMFLGRSSNTVFMFILMLMMMMWWCDDNDDDPNETCQFRD